MVNEVQGLKSALQLQINFNAYLIHCLSQVSVIYYEGVSPRV